jgi:hypothetical protein
MTINKRDARDWRAKIRDVLNREWDPIGVAAAGVLDEYDSYVGPIAAMISADASDDALVDYLTKIESDRMGFGRFNGDRGRKVVASIRALGDAP